MTESFSTEESRTQVWAFNAIKEAAVKNRSRNFFIVMLKSGWNQVRLKNAGGEFPVFIHYIFNL